jgi:formylglycine-generating enzyme required for sulfatase activity
MQHGKITKAFLLILFCAGFCTAQTAPEIEMVFVKGGTFLMGCTKGDKNCFSDEFPVHKVTVSDFYIGKYEVTQKEWKSIMGYDSSEFKGDNYPVEMITYDSIQSFLKKLNAITGKNYRLPTEAEWEYAARGGTKSKSRKFAGSNDVNAVAWHYGNSNETTHPVGTKAANELGIYDMSGNVWERCEDWYMLYENKEEKDPKGPENPNNFLFTRVARGGAWNSHIIEECSVSHRNGIMTDAVQAFFGFRVAMSAQEN